jgi:hypothetical protein
MMRCWASQKTLNPTCVVLTLDPKSTYLHNHLPTGDMRMSSIMNISNLRKKTVKSSANPKTESPWERRERLLDNVVLNIKLSDDKATLQLVNADTRLMNTFAEFHENQSEPKPAPYEIKQSHSTIKWINNNKAAKTVNGKCEDEDLIRGYETLDPKKDQLVNVRTSFNDSQMSALHAMSHYAFSYHKPVKLRAEDVHLLIVQGLANFVMQYPEDFRATLVAYDGKKILQVHMPDLETKELWEKMPHGFATLIRHLIKDTDIADIILQDYSHTTDIDRTIKAITLMGTFSAYMHYEAGSFCHIPEFTLEGTVEDWRKIAQLSEKLIEKLGITEAADNEPENGTHLLHRWLTRLHDNMLNKLYQARKGDEADKVFWSSFYKYISGSGGNAVTGNIVYFYPFLNVQEVDERRHMVEVKKLNHWIMNKKGIELAKSDRHGPKSSELAANIIDVPFMAVLNDVRYPAMISGGLVAAQKDQKDGSIKMVPEYSIFYTKSGHPPLPKQKAPKEIAAAAVAPISAPAGNSNNQAAATAEPVQKKAAQDDEKSRITFSF